MDPRSAEVTRMSSYVAQHPNISIEMARDDTEVAVEQLCTATAAMSDKV